MDLLNGKGIDDSTESVSGVTADQQNYDKCQCKVRTVIRA